MPPNSKATAAEAGRTSRDAYVTAASGCYTTSVFTWTSRPANVHTQRCTASQTCTTHFYELADSDEYCNVFRTFTHTVSNKHIPSVSGLSTLLRLFAKLFSYFLRLFSTFQRQEECQLCQDDEKINIKLQINRSINQLENKTDWKFKQFTKQS